MATTIPTLSFKPGRLNIELIANDDATVDLTVTTQDDPKAPQIPVDLTEAAVSFRLKLSDGTILPVPTTIDADPTTGHVAVNFSADLTAPLVPDGAKSVRIPYEYDVVSGGLRRTYLIGTVSIDPEIPNA